MYTTCTAGPGLSRRTTRVPPDSSVQYAGQIAQRCRQGEPQTMLPTGPVKACCQCTSSKHAVTMQPMLKGSNKHPVESLRTVDEETRCMLTSCGIARHTMPAPYPPCSLELLLVVQSGMMLNYQLSESTNTICKATYASECDVTWSTCTS